MSARIEALLIVRHSGVGSELEVECTEFLSEITRVITTKEQHASAWPREFPWCAWHSSDFVKRAALLRPEEAIRFAPRGIMRIAMDGFSSGSAANRWLVPDECD